ncbi:MAG: hypothetical protein H6740_01825 [Alphaproteobacteria bacterium]|nr:hypothetical protein [Alphaproteobacteria bacterium]
MYKSTSDALVFRPPAPRHLAMGAGLRQDAPPGGVLGWLTRERLEVRIDTRQGVVAVHVTRLFGAKHVLARYFAPELSAVRLHLEHRPTADGETELVADVLLLPADAEDAPIDLANDLPPDEAQALAEQVAEALRLPVALPPELARAM